MRQSWFLSPPPLSPTIPSLLMSGLPAPVIMGHVEGQCHFQHPGTPRIPPEPGRMGSLRLQEEQAGSRKATLPEGCVLGNTDHDATPKVAGPPFQRNAAQPTRSSLARNLNPILIKPLDLPCQYSRH